MQKIIKKIILWILLLILALNIFGCSNSEENIDLSQIVVNTRKDSHKIHRISCAYVDKMAEHNKWYPNKTIEELRNEGYEPCDICLVKTYKKYIEGKYYRSNIENKETLEATLPIV